MFEIVVGDFVTLIHRKGYHKVIAIEDDPRYPNKKLTTEFMYHLDGKPVAMCKAYYICSINLANKVTAENLQHLIDVKENYFNFVIANLKALKNIIENEQTNKTLI